MGDAYERKECRKCGHCCRFGSGFVLDKEIPEIAGSLGLSADDFQSRFIDETKMFAKKVFRFKTVKKTCMPFGPCIFQKGSICSINDFKPEHCQISSCSADGDEDNARFIINNFVDFDDPESVRQYHAYIATGGLVPKGLEIEKLVPKKRLADMLSYKILK